MARDIKNKPAAPISESEGQIADVKHKGKKERTRPSPLNCFKPRLNVVFHGPFLFIYYRGRVEVVTLAAPGHMVGAGTWLGEKVCHPGTYFLTGLNTSQDVSLPDAESHAIIDLAQLNNIGIALERHPYFRFILPRPSQMAPLASMVIDSPASVFVGHQQASIQAKRLGTAHVLSYKISGADHLQLEGMSWLPEFNRYQSIGGLPYNFAINLHIYAESAFVLDPDHPRGHFTQLVDMLPGLALGLCNPVTKLGFDRPCDDDCLGLIEQEQEGLRSLPRKQNEVPPKPGTVTIDFTPPLVCDAPSLVVLGAQDATP
jgi:hypothetical protein